ncbi:SixA phosphatase family protein [Psychroflexus maritimus]|uniref:Phosphohistidine phosphatase n=1 Tax=Psychroflexus maritimus TaxID=2714865 RepID=A0A967AB37_9FLAO|nr:histidine phosphatase family protein [Psychroflexus maritimus]NGZ88974.1 phosphohistidine phosphatase [Psychroflexus maritimus]
MKELILIRHGKSAWDNNFQDHDRPLQKRAYKDAELVAKILKKKADLSSYKMISSTAVRAKTSAQLLVEQLRIPASQFSLDEKLYNFDMFDVLHFLKLVPDQIQRLILVGHNPAFTEAANFLGDKYFSYIPTTGLVKLQLDSENWSNLQRGTTEFFIFPKDYR